MVVGEAAIVKSGAAVTVREMLTSCSSIPLVPETIKGYVSTAVDKPTSMVKVEVAVGVTDAGLKANVAPVGNPVRPRSTAVLKPFTEVTVIVEVPELP